MGNSAELRMFVCSSETRIVLVGIRGRHQHGWKEAKYGSHVEWKKLMKVGRSWRTNVIS